MVKIRDSKTRFELRLDKLLVEIIDEEIKNAYPPRSRNAQIEAVLMEKYGAQYAKLLKRRIREIIKPMAERVEIDRKRKAERELKKKKESESE